MKRFIKNKDILDPGKSICPVENIKTVKNAKKFWF